jgi:transglutaminase-like putative cysteine protease
MSIATQMSSPWATSIPKSVWLEFVATYSHTNEARTNWRPLLSDSVTSILSSASPAPSTIEDAVAAVNANLYNPSTSGLPNSVVFKSSQTPLIYDPMSTLAYGYASCTGVSILFANALRAAGIPARVAGTPAWNGVYENGNHK